MPKLSLRVETLEKQVSELLLKDKKREQQFQELSLQNEKIENQNKRLELLEQQLEKTKSENLGKVANDFWYKYRSEVHKIYSRYYDIIFNNINNFLFWSVLISFVSLLWVVSYTNINKFPFFIILILLIFNIILIFIYPFIAVFFQLKVYSQIKNPKNLTKILIFIGKFLHQSLITFIIKLGFPLTLFILIKLPILNNIRSKIINLDTDKLKDAIDSIMQGKDLSVVMYIFIFSITLSTIPSFLYLCKKLSTGFK